MLYLAKRIRTVAADSRCLHLIAPPPEPLVPTVTWTRYGLALDFSKGRRNRFVDWLTSVDFEELEAAPSKLPKISAGPRMKKIQANLIRITWNAVKAPQRGWGPLGHPSRTRPFEGR